MVCGADAHGISLAVCEKFTAGACCPCVRVADSSIVPAPTFVSSLSRYPLPHVRLLLAPTQQLLTSCLTMRKLSTGNVVVPYKVDEAGHTRDAMTKTLYSLLFEWIIKEINKTLEVSTTARAYVCAFTRLCG